MENSVHKRNVGFSDEPVTATLITPDMNTPNMNTPVVNTPVVNTYVVPTQQKNIFPIDCRLRICWPCCCCCYLCCC